MTARILMASLVGFVLLGSTTPGAAQQVQTQIVESPDGDVVVVLPNSQEVTLQSGVAATLENAIPGMLQGQSFDNAVQASTGLLNVNTAGPQPVVDAVIDPGTSQPSARELVNLDQEINRQLTSEGTGTGPSAGNANAGGGDDGGGGDGGGDGGESETAAAESFDEAVFEVRDEETFSPDGN